MNSFTVMYKVNLRCISVKNTFPSALVRAMGRINPGSLVSFVFASRMSTACIHATGITPSLHTRRMTIIKNIIRIGSFL